MTAPDPVTASEAVAAATGNPPAPRRAVLGGVTSRIAWSVLALLVLLALCAPLIAPYPPGEQDLMDTFAPPSGEHWLGTDNLGRDQLSRLLYGLRASLAIALMTTAAVALFGIPLGAVAGYARGFLNTAIARFIDMGLALPSLVLALALIAALGAGTKSTVIALAAGYTPYLARVVRSVVMRIREEPYVDSARVSGVHPIRILARHVVPNTLAVTSVQLTLIFAFAIISEAGLSFVGLGVQSPNASLGSMLASGAEFSLDLPLLAVAPGLTIAVLVIALLFAGDSIRDAVDPRRTR
ncbi:MAG TPA: ABC transporter permease [Nocardioides sp.]|nr:ABC transporter permease [Nocardioides sp.]